MSADEMVLNNPRRLKIGYSQDYHAGSSMFSDHDSPMLCLHAFDDFGQMRLRIGQRELLIHRHDQSMTKMNPLSVNGSLHFADETAWKGSAPGVGGTKSSPETASLAARLGNFEKRP